MNTETDIIEKLNFEQRIIAWLEANQDKMDKFGDPIECSRPMRNPLVSEDGKGEIYLINYILKHHQQSSPWFYRDQPWNQTTEPIFFQDVGKKLGTKLYLPQGESIEVPALETIPEAYRHAREKVNLGILANLGVEMLPEKYRSTDLVILTTIARPEQKDSAVEAQTQYTIWADNGGLGVVPARLNQNGCKTIESNDQRTVLELNGERYTFLRKPPKTVSGSKLKEVTDGSLLKEEENLRGIIEYEKTTSSPYESKSGSIMAALQDRLLLGDIELKYLTKVSLEDWKEMTPVYKRIRALTE